MPYRFDDGEAVPVALRRCAREQLEGALHELTEEVESDPVKAVHEARKSLKKERSLLRLGRATLDRAQRRRENESFRDAGRRLSGVRDADVMLQALDAISDRYSGQVPKTSFDAVRERLAARREAARAALVASESIGLASEELRSALQRTDAWRLRRGGWKAIAPGLSRSYKRGRKAFKRARGGPSTENLHEWRKRCKDLWYHLRLLSSAAPETMEGHAGDAHRLSELLGDDHDLAVLRQAVAALEDEVAVDVGPLFGLIDHRREQLQTQAWLLGERLYAEKPSAFLRRLHRYWKAWRAETKAMLDDKPVELANLTRHPAAA